MKYHLHVVITAKDGREATVSGERDSLVQVMDEIKRGVEINEGRVSSIVITLIPKPITKT